MWDLDLVLDLDLDLDLDRDLDAYRWCEVDLEDDLLLDASLDDLDALSDALLTFTSLLLLSSFL